MKYLGDRRQHTPDNTCSHATGRTSHAHWTRRRRRRPGPIRARMFRCSWRLLRRATAAWPVSRTCCVQRTQRTAFSTISQRLCAMGGGAAYVHRPARRDRHKAYVPLCRYNTFKALLPRKRQHHPCRNTVTKVRGRTALGEASHAYHSYHVFAITDRRSILPAKMKS